MMAPSSPLGRIAAVVLAAGTSSRYRAQDRSVPTKLVADLDGMPLVRRAALAALGSGASPVVIVTGHAEAYVREALSGLDVAFVHNPAFASGLSSSLRAGLAAVPSRAPGALVLLGDMPNVTAALLDSLIEAFEGSDRIDAVVPVQDGRRGNPVLLGRSLFSAAGMLDGDEGARRLLLSARVLEIPTAGDAVVADIDDPAALRRWRAKGGHSRRGLEE